MYQTALLLLSGPFRIVIESISRYFKCTDKKVLKRLYVKLEPDLTQPIKKCDSPYLNFLSSIVPVVYSNASVLFKNVDVRLLLGNHDVTKREQKSSLNFETIFSNEKDILCVKKYAEQNFGLICEEIVDINESGSINHNDRIENDTADYQTYKTVCLGGTFDRLHNGHKVLLSEAVLKSTDKLVVGVSSGSTLKRKVLWELIEPVEKRMEDVAEFLKDIDPSLQYEIVPITDVYGPTITVPSMDCLVLTTETKVGGDKVNEERKKRGMKEMTLHVVELVENTEHSIDEDEKLSSSTNRMRILGQPRNQKPPIPGKPYCILFQGHPVCGRTAVCNKLQAMGIPILCCDDILQAILTKDEDFKDKLAEQYSEDTSFYSSGLINFEELFKACIKNKEKKDWLAEYTHDKMKSSLHQVLQVYKEQGINTIIIKDSTVFENEDLEIDFDEIWASILPISEASKLLQGFYHVSEDEALELLEYFSNENYVKRANILFCNKWSSNFLQEQVDKAYSYLVSRKDTY